MQGEVKVQERKPTKLQPVRVPMPELDPQVRGCNFEEVALGYTPEQAIAEANRCLACKNEPCRDGCPVNVPVKDFILLIQQGEFQAATAKIKETNNLPAVCGRVCPQENQCEKPCIVGKKGDPVGIGNLERFAADWEFAHGGPAIPERKPLTGRRVAVIGAGPAGLTAAADLARAGHGVTIFEALHTAGGVLQYGIPQFRLPKNIIDAEIETIRRLGVEIKVNAVIGKLRTIDELLSDGYEAVFIGVGAGAPMFLGIPGEHLNGVYSANEFLTRVNLMRGYEFPEFDTPVKRPRRVVVVGAGNTAMDAARTALRLGAEEVRIVYRRTFAEAAARAAELHHAKEEGIIFNLLTSPVEVVGENGWVTGLRCEKMKLGEPDESGRARPVPTGEIILIPCDAVIPAIGTCANPLVQASTPGLETDKRGYISAELDGGATSRPGVFAGGDIVTGAATVILAMGAGKRSAAAVDEYLASL